jgi:hypothetical protein
MVTECNGIQRAVEIAGELKDMTRAAIGVTGSHRLLIKHGNLCLCAGDTFSLTEQKIALNIYRVCINNRRISLRHNLSRQKVKQSHYSP